MAIAWAPGNSAPTSGHGIYLAVQFTDLCGVLRHRSGPAQFTAALDREEDQPAARELPLLCRLESALRDPAVDLDGRRLEGRQLDQCRTIRAPAQAHPRPVPGRKPRVPRLLQV